MSCEELLAYIIVPLYDKVASNVVQMRESFFGFSEFLTGLAFLLMVWVTSDYRYKFRFHISMFSTRFCFFSVVSIGVIILVDDFLFSLLWNNPFVDCIVQFICALLLLAVIVYWFVVAFIRPPVFNKSNHERYKAIFCRAVNCQNEDEMKTLVHEMSYSMPNLVRFAPQIYFEERELSEIEKDVSLIFAVMGSEYYCRNLVRYSIDTAVALFDALEKQKRYSIGLECFARNFITESLRYEDSYAYRESDYRNGFFGLVQPTIARIYGNGTLLLNLRGLLEPDYSLTSAWNHKHIHAYVTLLSKAFDTCYGECQAIPMFSRTYEILERSAYWSCRAEYYGREYIDMFREVMYFYKGVIQNILPQKNLFAQKQHYAAEYNSKDFLDRFVDSVVQMFVYAGRYCDDDDNRHIIQYLYCFDSIFGYSETKNDVIAFYEKIKEATVLKAKEKTGLEGIYILFLFLENFGVNVTRHGGNEHLSELHALLIDVAKKQLLETYKNVHNYRTFKMPERLSIDIEKKELTIRSKSIDKEIVQKMDLE